MPKYDIRTKATVEEGIVFNEADSLNYGKVRIVEYQPGNGTRYVLVITRVAEPATSPEKRDKLGTGGEVATYLVAKLNAGAGTAMLVGGVKHFLHYSSVQEKLKVGISDAVVLAELIGTLLGMPYMTCEEFEAREAETED